MENKIITFHNLSWPLKIATIFAWVVGIFWSVNVLMGFWSSWSVPV